MVDRPDPLCAWLGQHLPVAEVLPFGAITDSPYDESDHVVFDGKARLTISAKAWPADASATT